MAQPPHTVLCFDGTGNEFGLNNTNVIRLIQSMNRDDQRLYYDPGVGTLPEPGLMTSIGKKTSEVVGLAFGAGLMGKVSSAYRFLMDFWEPGSRVYIFGFSRGAYTARVLAAMLHSLGLLSRGNDDLVPYAIRLFKSLRSGVSTDQDNPYWKLTNGFRKTFARAVDNDARRFRVHLLGLWDTVSSVGWVWEPASFPFTTKNESVLVARHAISIDESRAFFRQNRLSPASGQDCSELWFPGVHSDIGGGYPEREGGLWLVAFDWMVQEAVNNGFLVDAARLSGVRNHSVKAPDSPWLEPKHESLKGAWKLAEYFPKRRWTQDAGYSYQMNKGRPRQIKDGELIHESALRRVRDTDYRPSNFSDHFIEKIKGLATIPATLCYESTAQAN
jgi:uncharacterized protein (DUF2235 family)